MVPLVLSGPFARMEGTASGVDVQASTPFCATDAQLRAADIERQTDKAASRGLPGSHRVERNPIRGSRTSTGPQIHSESQRCTVCSDRVMRQTGKNTKAARDSPRLSAACLPLNHFHSFPQAGVMSAAVRFVSKGSPGLTEWTPC